MAGIDHLVGLHFESDMICQGVTAIVLSTTCLVAVGVHAQEHKSVVVRRIAVVNELSQPVLAKLNLRTADNKETYFAETNEKGIAEPNKPCPLGTRVKTYPAVPQYLEPWTLPTCASVMRIVLQRYGIALEMVKMGDMAYQGSKYGRATLVYTEAAYRLATNDPATAARVEAKAYQAAAQQFGISKFFAYDSSQTRAVITPYGASVLRDYQSRNRIPVTGQLDVQTAQKLAGESIFPHIRSAYDALEKKD